MQTPKVGSLLEFLQAEANISSARALLLAEQFAKNGYEKASDFAGMTELELNDEHLRDKMGLSLVDMRKFRAAVSRISRPPSAVGPYEGAPSVKTSGNSQTPLTGISVVPPQENQMRSRNFSVTL